MIIKKIYACQYKIRSGLGMHRQSEVITHYFIHVFANLHVVTYSIWF
jgi:hypothetical protein